MGSALKRHPLWLALAGAVCVASGCSSNNKNGPSGDPPVVTLGILNPNGYGTSFSFTALVTGCDSVKNVSLFDHNTYIHHVGYPTNSGTTVTVTLQPNQVPYSHGIAADLSLQLQAECSDGRIGKSQPAAARFLPVVSVYQSTSGTPSVPDVFVADGSGQGVAFLGCSINAGQSQLLRVDRWGSVMQSVNLTNYGASCDNSLYISDKSPETGSRWIFEPSSAGGNWVMEIDPALNVLTFLNTGLAPQALTLAPNGDAILYNSGLALGALMRVNSCRTRGNGGTCSSSTGSIAWAGPTNLSGIVQTPSPGTLVSQPVVNRDLTTYLAYSTQSAPINSVIVQKVDSRTGVEIGRYVIRSYNVPSVGTIPLPAVTLDPTGEVVYIAVIGTNGSTSVFACSSNVNGCQPPSAQKWASNAASIPYPVEFLLPYAGGSTLAAVTGPATYFIDTYFGGVSLPTFASGSLVANQIQQGNGRDFYLMNGSGSGGLPTEIVAIDSPQNGEVFRYSVASNSSLSAAIDESGQAWIRFGPLLAQPYPLSQYRAVHP